MGSRLGFEVFVGEGDRLVNSGSSFLRCKRITTKSRETTRNLKKDEGRGVSGISLFSFMPERVAVNFAC